MTLAAAARHSEAGLDVILRCRDPARRLELQRAVFSLVGQSYRPLQIILATQRFAAAETEAIRAGLAPMLSWAGDVTLTPLNYPRCHPEDARAELINLGFAAATGRYVALLEDDGVLYPEAHDLLVGRLRDSGAAIAFGRIAVLRADVHDGFLHARALSHPYPGRTLGDLFRGDFCPIHGFVIDRARVPPDTMRLDPLLTIADAYDLLMRVCALARADLALIDTEIGLQVMTTDAGKAGDPSPESRAAVARFLEARRGLVTLSPEVQRDLGLADPIPGLTVRRWLDSVA